MRLTKDNILKALSLLNISTNHQIHDGWLSIKCPFHIEKTPYNACFVNIETGSIHCFSCDNNSSVISLIKSRFNITYKEALEKIDNTHSYPGTRTYRSNSNKENKSNISKQITHDFEEISFPPANFYYTEQRGFTEEFCKQFNITRSLSGIYNDYMIIPVKDSEQKIDEFEARKLMEYEYLCRLFNIIKGDYKRLKRNFAIYIEKNKIKMDNYLVIQDGEIIDSPVLKYLLSPKVKYVTNSQLYKTIWNIDNLNYNEDLYLTEGIGSMPKIWTHISRNCSCTFGSNIDDNQIKILKRFKKIILIPDDDVAGNKMITKLNVELKNIVFKKIKIDDTNNQYVEKILKAKELELKDFINLNFFRRKI